MQAAALAFYILSALFVDSFVIIFVITVLLAALDFWVVKNVSGRILVGLRWWNEINDLGESVWKFESLDQEVSSNSGSRQITLAIAKFLLNCNWRFYYWQVLNVLPFPFLIYLLCCIVIGTHEQEGLMAVLVEPLSYSK